MHTFQDPICSHHPSQFDPGHYPIYPESVRPTATVALATAPPDVSSATGVPEAGALSEPTSGPQVYVVRQGDTLSSIAARFGTTLNALKKAWPDAPKGAALADWSKINPSVVTDIMKPQIFYILAGILVIAGILTAIYVREFSLTGHTQETQDVQTPKPTSDHFTAVLDTFKNREFRRFAPSWFCIMMIIGMSTTFLPIILAGGAHSEVTGSSIESASTMIVGVGLIAITQPFFGRLSDKHGRKPFLLIGAVAAMIAIISLGFAVQEFILQGKNLTSELMKPANFYITIPLLLGILGAGAFGPSALALLADVTKAEKRGQAMGVYSFMLGLGEIMGDIIGGAFWDFFEGRYGEGSGPVGIVILGSTLSIIAVVVVVKYILETRYLDEIVHSVLKPVNNQETPPQT